MANKRILIIEDDETTRTLLDELLTAEGYVVCAAASGDEGIKKASQEKPDLVLLDTVMPVMDGIETCRRIKHVEKVPAKVIMYTAKIDAIDAVRAREFGADDYCIKGQNPEFLLKAIKGILEK
jgi:two-component system alkaline phosphatase synthesis response regulator PhoP